ncbi:nuclear transport factor 2 family protein [Chryseobacterium sp. 18068]|uniref:nuclear transport factor 2 family protein n=1 Tax=Chryseobacterium sp. 18068 TaxID=2681414 RepID=UPI00135B9B80|nr:nuclear transport factor 2 family protein [Chryseobacterium sp. 18068]
MVISQNQKKILQTKNHLTQQNMDKTAITRENIIEAENKLFSAQLVSNVDILDQLLHDDLLAVAPTGQIITKEMDLNSHKAKTMIIENASIEIDDIKITGDTALSIVTMTSKGSIMETPLEGKFRYFRVWKRFDDSLKIIGASFMQLPD